MKELLKVDNQKINQSALSADAKQIKGGIDRQFSAIAAFRGSPKYEKQKDEYEIALNNLRLACIDFSEVSSSGEIESIGT